MTTFTAKSVVVDCADNYGNSLMCIRSIEFHLSGSLIPVTSGFVAYGTSRYSTNYSYEMIFNTSLSKTGVWQYTSWVSNNASTNQRVIIVFDTPITFDEIVVNNGHSDGTVTDSGAKNVKIQISDDAISNVTYNAAVSNSYLLFDGIFDQHVAANIADDKTLSLIPPPYKVSGTVTVNGSPAARTVAVFLRDGFTLLGTTTSNATTGAFELNNWHLSSSTDALLVTAIDSTGDYNAVSVDYITAVAI